MNLDLLDIWDDIETGPVTDEIRSRVREAYEEWARVHGTIPVISFDCGPGEGLYTSWDHRGPKGP